MARSPRRSSRSCTSWPASSPPTDQSDKARRTVRGRDDAPELLIGAAVDVAVNAESSFVGRLSGVEDRFDQLTILVVITVIAWLAESASEYLAVLSWRYLAQAIQHDARMDAYRRVQDLEVAYFEDQTSGGLMTVLNEDVNQLERFLDMDPHKIITTAANVVLVGLAFFIISPLLMTLAFIPIPVIIAGSLLYQQRLEPRYAKVRRAAGTIGDTLTNGLGGIATIKAFSAEAREIERVGAQSDEYQRVNRDAIRLSTAFRPLIRTAVLAGFTMTLFVGGRAALRGELEIGLFSVLVYMTQRLLWPLTDLGETLDLYQRAMASCPRIFGLMEAEPTILPGTRELPSPVRGTVRFEGVSFRYASSPDDVVRSIDHVSSDRTTIVIAHRLSTVRHADRIHVMERGRIVESGTHDELVSHGGLYAALWRVQTGEAGPLPAA